MTRPACPHNYPPEQWHDACLEVERVLRILNQMGILLHTSYSPHYYALEATNIPEPKPYIDTAIP
jgi:hypothetical protein